MEGERVGTKNDDSKKLEQLPIYLIELRVPKRVSWACHTIFSLLPRIIFISLAKNQRVICFTSLPADFLGSRRQEGLDQECSHEETQAARKRGFSQQILLNSCL
jgi:hypothetical protein